MNPYKIILPILFTITTQQLSAQLTSNCENVSFNTDKQIIDTSKFLIILSGIADTTAYLLSGTVVDRITGLPVKGAEIFMVEKNETVLGKSSTGSDGTYKITLFTIDDDIKYLKISHPQFKCLTIGNFEFHGVNLYDIKIKLNPN